MPPEFEERLFGYVQLDKDSEEILSHAENLTHYGFMGRKPIYKALRKSAQFQLDELLTRLGFRRPGDQSEREREMLHEAAQDLTLCSMIWEFLEWELAMKPVATYSSQSEDLPSPMGTTTSREGP